MFPPPGLGGGRARSGEVSSGRAVERSPPSPLLQCSVGLVSSLKCCGRSAELEILTISSPSRGLSDLARATMRERQAASSASVLRLIILPGLWGCWLGCLSTPPMFVCIEMSRHVRMSGPAPHYFILQAIKQLQTLLTTISPVSRSQLSYLYIKQVKRVLARKNTEHSLTELISSPFRF